VITNAEKINKGEEKDFSKLGVEAVDAKTLKVTLEKSAPYFLALIRHSSFLPVHKATIEKFGTDWTKPGNFVGNGAFTLAEWTPQSSLTLAKNPGYYDAGEREARQDRLLSDRRHLGRVQALPQQRARHHLRGSLGPGEVHRGPT
jgi:ABC-type oligopeptide transport system substrate-binding subunit